MIGNGDPTVGLGFACALEGGCAFRIAQPNLRILGNGDPVVLGFAYALEGGCAFRIAQPNLP